MSIQALSTSPVYQPPETQKVSPVPAAPEPESGGRAPAYDRYTPEDPAQRETAGLYWISRGEDGSPVVQMDDNARPEGAKAQQTTTNTDRVDREIERLERRLEELETRLNTAAPEQREALERQRDQVARELARKNNDTYRRQHAVVS